MTSKQLNKKKGTPLIEIRNLTKAFGNNLVLKGFDLQLFPGENLVILGKSGSGKSVLIKCLVRLLNPDDGEIEILGKRIIDLDQKALDEIRTEVGFLFQGSALYDSMTVRENLRFPLRRHPERKASADEDQLILASLKSVGLEDAIDLMPAELSGGMKRRVALARTLILKPKIILYDEPTTGLDPITANEIIQLMLKLQDELGTASIIITHDMDCARVISNRVIILTDGINYAEGTYQELDESKDPKVSAFFKDINKRNHG
ncbi:ABC transporter ATP-binding protein [Neolewinella persica]|uniref:ABC transporter ATP-binding protein n=1 Tax=Neolewinella persica TaxID=70998 RepID=UPI000382AA83|nr:ATP-binding cassette domain-containing protein [Neolewinella persica]